MSNFNDKERLDTLGLYAKEYVGGCIHFEHVAFDQLCRLKEKGYLDMEEAHNGAPTVGWFLKYIEEHPTYEVHGYVVSPERHDCRVSITGIDVNGSFSEKEQLAFMKEFRFADDLSVNENFLYCWYD